MNEAEEQFEGPDPGKIFTMIYGLIMVAFGLGLLILGHC